MALRNKAATVADHLLQDMVTASQPGQILPPERELAKSLGISRNTVRRAIRELRNAGWLRSVHGHGHKVVQPELASARTVGLLCGASAASLLASATYRELLSGICQAVEGDDGQLLIVGGMSSGRSGKLWPAAVRRAESLATLGVFDAALIEAAARLSPTVCIDADCRAKGVSSVRFDHAGSTHMAVKYLQDLGHRRVALCLSEAQPAAALALQLQGYRNGMRWFAGEDADRLICRMPEDAPADRAVAQLLAGATGARPTAIVAIDMFWGLAAALARAGLRVPRDISLINIAHVSSCTGCVNFDAGQQAGQPGQPGQQPQARIAGPVREQQASPADLVPTTIRLPARQMGAWAVEELIRRRNHPAEPAQHQVFAPTLHIGNTAAQQAHPIAT